MWLHSHMTEERWLPAYSHLALLQSHCHAQQDCVKQDLYASPYLYGVHSNNAAFMWLLLWFLSLWGVTESLWGVIPCTSLILHKSLLCIVHPSTLTLPGCGLPKNPTVQVSIRSSHLIWKYVCFQMVCSFLTCLKNMILFFYFGKSDLFTH